MGDMFLEVNNLTNRFENLISHTEGLRENKRVK